MLTKNQKLDQAKVDIRHTVGGYNTDIEHWGIAQCNKNVTDWQTSF